MPNELLDDIQFKARNGAQISVDSAQGIVECFVSGIGNKDSVGDIVLPGAFNESLKRRKPRVVWGHSWNDPIGKVLEIYEVANSDPRLPEKMKSAGIGGLFAKVQFNLGAEKGREAFANVAFFGEEQEWSIGYKTLQATFDPVKQANLLKEVELYEVSPVLHGANQLTGTISVKDGEYGACGTDGCECGTKSHIASEPDIQVEEEEVFIFEKGQMMGRVPMQMIVIPMPQKPNSDSHDADRDIWARGEAGPIDMAARMELAQEIHSRTKVPIKIVEATENMVVFLRKMVDGTNRMYRMGYHKAGDGRYMFGKPARVKPQTVYSPVQPNMPPIGPMSHKPNHHVSPIQGKETIEEAKSDYLISCTLDNIFEFKDTLQPIFDYYEVTVTPSVAGLLCSDYPSGFEDAANTAIKALGGRLGRGGGLGKGRRAGRALTATFDPKAWDGDGDGIVQEGTPFQRPSIPGINTNWPGEPKTRFKPDHYPNDSAQVREARKPRRDPNRTRPGSRTAPRRGVLDARRRREEQGVRSERGAAYEPIEQGLGALAEGLRDALDPDRKKKKPLPKRERPMIPMDSSPGMRSETRDHRLTPTLKEGNFHISETLLMHTDTELNKRPILLVELADGTTQPFYMRSGTGDRAVDAYALGSGEGGSHGNWVPFDGFGLGRRTEWFRKEKYSDSEGPTGPGEPLHRYGNEELKKVGETLDASKNVQEMLEDRSRQIPIYHGGADEPEGYVPGNDSTLMYMRGDDLNEMLGLPSHEEYTNEVFGQIAENQRAGSVRSLTNTYKYGTRKPGGPREGTPIRGGRGATARTGAGPAAVNPRGAGARTQDIEWDALKAQLPSQAIRNMSPEERKSRIADLDKKLDVLEAQMDDVGRLDAEYPEMKQRFLQLDSERRKHLISAAIHSWESGRKSFVRLPIESKGVELELTPDEIDSLRSHIKALIGKSKDSKVNGILAKYDQKLIANKDGVVKIPRGLYHDFTHAWDKVSPPTQSRMHPKTGRDILEFAALSPTQKFRSSQLDLPDNKYRGFGNKRINNGAHPDITPANQAKMMEAIGAPRGERRGLYLPSRDYLMFADLKEHDSGSPRRWAIMEGQYTHGTKQGRTRTDLPGLPGEPMVETQAGSRRADMGGPNMGRGGRTRRQSRSGPQSLRAMPGDLDALFDEPTAEDIIPDVRDVRPEDRADISRWNAMDDAALSRLGQRRVERLARRSEARRAAGEDAERRQSNDLLSRWDAAATGTSRDPARGSLRSENKIPRRATADEAKPETRGRPMGHVVEDSQERFKGKKFEEIKPDDWDDLSTEDKFALLSAEMTPKKSGIRQIDYDRIYAQLSKVIEKRERRQDRSEGRFETMAERRARRGGIVMSPSVRRRETEGGEPKRTTAQAAKTKRKNVLDRLESSLANADNRATSSGDAVRGEHADVWSEALDIVAGSDDLTHSQLRALDGLFESYLSRESGDLSPVEGELRAAALSRKSHIEDLLSDYEGDRFISEGDTPEIRTLGGDGGDLDIMEVNNLELFSSDGLRSIRQNSSKLPGTSTREYVDARRRQGLRSQTQRSREEKIGDLRNLWRNAQATNDTDEMDRLERQLRELNAGPPPNARARSIGRARANNRQNAGGNFRNSGGMRSEREGRAQITGEATWFKKIEDSLQKEIDVASRDKDKQTADALRTLKRTLARQESGKTGDKRTNAGSLTVTQTEIDEMLDALMHVLDRQTAEKGSRTEMFAELIEKLSSAAISTFILKETEEIQSRTRKATNEAGRTVDIPNTDL